MSRYHAFLEELLEQEKIREIDLAFGAFLARCAKVPEDSPLAVLGTLISRSFTVENETNLPDSRIRTKESLAGYLDIPDGRLPEGLPRPEDFPEIISAGDSVKPLVFFQECWYLGRNFQYETLLRNRMAELCALPVAPCTEEFEKLTSLTLEEGQKQAIRLAGTGRFAVISGGPGTGKTTIVSVILALRREKAENVILCAPTGKAQMRMRLSLNREITNLHLPQSEVEELMKIQSSTIHRMLQWDVSSGKFCRNRKNPLPYTLYIIDECSMIPLSLMASLWDAIPEKASIILLGDRFQLSSVEPGSVFGNFCDSLKGDPCHYAELSVSRRFREGEGICRLKDAINAGESAEAWRILTENVSPQLSCGPIPEEKDTASAFFAEFEGSWLRNGRPFVLQETLNEAWKSFDAFRILTPVNSGPQGTEKLNEKVRALLGLEGELETPGDCVLVTENSYAARLFNGDTGMLWFADEAGQPLSRKEAAEQKCTRLLLFFPDMDEKGHPFWRGVPRSALPSYQPAFVMTVHKSQGSDYTKILMILPELEKRRRSLLSREILYTGVTRAREHLSFRGSKESFAAAVETTGQKK